MKLDLGQCAICKNQTQQIVTPLHGDHGGPLVCPICCGKWHAERGRKWWLVTAFSKTAQAELMRLGDGDALSVQGSFKAELYDKDGDKRLSLSLVADCVLALRQQRRTKSAPDT